MVNFLSTYFDLECCSLFFLGFQTFKQNKVERTMIIIKLSSPHEAIIIKFGILLPIYWSGNLVVDRESTGSVVFCDSWVFIEEVW